MMFKNILSGDQAFYLQRNYEQLTRQELDSREPISNPAFVVDFESKKRRIIKNILSIILFPIGLYRLFHSLLGFIIVPASMPYGFFYNFPHIARKGFDLHGEWKLKRISISVDGCLIDASIMGKPSTLSNGRWILTSLGNGQFYEEFIQSSFLRDLLTLLDANVLAFNYPGVGSSTGMPSRHAMAKAYQALLSFLEDEERGIGVKEIICYSYSIGAGVQADALLSHSLKKGIKYCFVKSQTFSNIYSLAESISGKLSGLIVRLMGWNMNPYNDSITLKAPEVIVQKASVNKDEEISDPKMILDDGVISAEASLAIKLLEMAQENSSILKNKYFLGIPEGHNDLRSNPSLLAKKIDGCLAAQ